MKIWDGQNYCIKCFNHYALENHLCDTLIHGIVHKIEVIKPQYENLNVFGNQNVMHTL